MFTPYLQLISVFAGDSCSELKSDFLKTKSGLFLQINTKIGLSDKKGLREGIFLTFLHYEKFTNT